MSRIALVFRARAGGVQRTQVDLANALAEYGAAVSVVMPCASGPYLSELHDSVEIVDFGTSSHLRFVWRLAGYLRRHAPDRLLASQYHVGVFAVIANLLAGRPARVIIVAYNHLTSLLAGERSGWILKLLMRLSYGQAHAVVCCSRGVAEDVVQQMPHIAGKIHVVYTPISVERIQARGRAARCGEPWLDSKSAPVLLAVGRLVAQKDYPTLLRALAICSRDTVCRLVIIGDGQDGPALQALAAELNVASRVRFLGARSDPYPFMARADALVTSSRFEGFPGVIVEALALGIPVIATDCRSGPGEILDEGRYGTLVPVGDPDRLAQALRALLRGETRFRPIDLERRADAFSLDRGLPPYLRLLGLAPE